MREVLLFLAGRQTFGTLSMLYHLMWTHTAVWRYFYSILELRALASLQSFSISLTVNALFLIICTAENHN